MKQAQAGKGHDHAIPVTAVNHEIIPNGTAGLCHIAHAAAPGADNVVIKREKSVAGERHTVNAGEICCRLLCGQRLRPDRKIALPNAVGTDTDRKKSVMPFRI